MTHSNIEIEAHFINIDMASLKSKLHELKAIDLGEDILKEIIFYDAELKWKAQKKFVRLRKTKNGILISSKHFIYKQETDSVDAIPEVQEVNVKVDDWETTKSFLESIGLVPFREQEKKRHSFQLGEVMIDIDTWPGIPPYVEIEGPSQAAIQKVSTELGFDWSKAIFRGASYMIEHFYHVPVTSYRYFTFTRIE